ncbi:PEP-CTERM sorting domain-containing protein [Schlesneria sp. T3-172]|uniref:PEP-CTERM sorting domain-containing protein n=1 Tax=Schlesneria sphaerica TaxID=3373610 RepID=UPI0037C9D3A8
MIRRTILVIMMLVEVGFWSGSAKSLDASLVHAKARTVSYQWDSSQEGDSAVVSEAEYGGSGLAYSYIDEHGWQKLGALSSATVSSSTAPEQNILSRASWSDIVTIAGGNTPQYVNLSYRVTGNISATGDNAHASFVLKATTHTTVQANEWRYSGRVEGGGIYTESTSHGWDDNPGENWLTFKMYFYPVLSPQNELLGVGSYTVEATTLVGVLNGTSIADYSHTAVLARVTLPDGRTPEEAGYTLTFESGLTSPNLLATAVPEPTSIGLLSVGGVCFSLCRLRRSKSVVAC